MDSKNRPQILKSELRDTFSSALLQRTAFSCGIFSLVGNALLRPALQDRYVPNFFYLLRSRMAVFSESNIFFIMDY
jgi:hypothetical protein